MTTNSLRSPPAGAEVGPAQAAAEILRRREARRSMLAFTRYTMPEYRPGWHHAVLCRHLDRFARGLLKRLMVFLPPRPPARSAVCPSARPALTGQVEAPPSPLFSADVSPSLLTNGPLTRGERRPQRRAAGEVGSESPGALGQGPLAADPSRRPLALPRP